MILEDIVACKKIQIEKEKEINPLRNYLPFIQNKAVRNFKAAINKENISIIAEIKRASPSKGIIREGFDPVKTAEIYESLEIDAVSVLTEKKFFMGKDEYIAQAKLVNSKPMLRKDFILDEYQIIQAKAIGADAVLLIASILGKDIRKFYELTRELGLEALAEVHDERELDQVLNAGCDIVGINNRNLRDFTVSLNTTEKLIKNIPEDILVVSESGIKTEEDIKYLNSLGVNAVLIGEAFMRNIDNRDKIKEFIFNAKVRG
jgi:indole-3-glycerol phosphate synthase